MAHKKRISHPLWITLKRFMHAKDDYTFENKYKQMKNYP